MDKKLFDYIEDHSPKFNPIIANGLAVSQFQLNEQYIEGIIRCAEPGFPEGMRFERAVRCTPHEAYMVTTAKRNNRRTYELTRSDLYMMKYIFSYQGEELKPRYLYLPFIKDAGIITLLGSTFMVSPTLADKTISVGTESIFIPLNRDKLTFRRLVHQFICDNQRESAYVVWSAIHHGAKSPRKGVKRTIEVNATNMHYVLCRYGFTRTFKEYANADVVAGMEEINTDNYPPDQWRICSSQRIKPRGVKGKHYIGSDIRLAIRREHWNLTTASMIAAFFYVADHFPDRFYPEYLDDVQFWKVLMGHVIFARNESEGKLLIGVETHLLSLDGYVDAMVKEWLREDGVEVNDIYDLFMHVVESFTARITESSPHIASMYGKRYSIHRYVLMDVIKGIFNMLFAIQQVVKKNKLKPLTKKEISDIMQDTMKTEAIIKMNRNHQEVTSVSSPGDNKVFKITTNVVLQNSSAGKKSGSDATVEPSKLAHVSIIEVGSPTNLPKSEPSGRSRANVFQILGPDCSITRDPKRQEMLDKIQEQIQR